MAPWAKIMETQVGGHGFGSPTLTQKPGITTSAVLALVTLETSEGQGSLASQPCEVQALREPATKHKGKMAQQLKPLAVAQRT